MTRKLGVYSLLVLTVFTALSVLIPLERVSAAENGSWVNVGTITIGDREFIDRDPFGDDKNFKRTGQDGCVDEILGFSDGNNNRAKYINRTKPTGGACDGSEVDINLANSLRAFIYFMYVDAGSIEPAVEALAGYGLFVCEGFPDCTGASNQFVRQQEDGDDCQDFIETTPGSGNTDVGKLFEHTTDRRSGRPTLAGCFFAATVLEPDAYEVDSIPGDDTLDFLIGGLSNRAIPSGDGEPSVVDGGDSDGDGEPDEAGSCEEANEGVILSWFLCSVMNFFDNTIDGLNNAVVDLLDVDPGYYSDERLQKSWAYFRNVASFMLIIIGLVMIIGQAVTKE